MIQYSNQYLIHFYLLTLHYGSKIKDHIYVLGKICKYFDGIMYKQSLLQKYFSFMLLHLFGNKRKQIYLVLRMGIQFIRPKAIKMIMIDIVSNIRRKKSINNNILTRKLKLKMMIHNNWHKLLNNNIIHYLSLLWYSKKISLQKWVIRSFCKK